MVSQRTSTTRSFVQYFAMSLLGFSLLHTGSAFAADGSDKTVAGGGGYAVIRDKCDRMIQAAQDAGTKYTEACGDYGTTNCTAAINRCKNATSSEYDSSGSILAALGMPASEATSKCSKYSGQDFYKRKDDYNDKIEKLNDKMTEIKDKQAELKSDYDEQVQKTTEELDKLNEDMANTQLNMNQKQRDQAAKLADDKSQQDEIIRQKTSEILSLRIAVSNVLRQKNIDMISINNAAAKQACNSEVLKLKAEIKNANTPGSSSSLIGTASSQKKALQAKFDACMATMNEKRNSVVEKSDGDLATIQNKMDDAQAAITSATAKKAQLDTDANAQKSDNATAMTNAQVSLNKKILAAQAKLKSLKETTTQKSNTLTQQMTYYQKKVIEYNNQVRALGAGPEDTTSDTKISKVQQAYENYKDIASDACFTCPDDYKKPICNEIKDDSGSGSSTSTGGSRSSRAR